jgi:hypothetical protein
VSLFLDLACERWLTAWPTLEATLDWCDEGLRTFRNHIVLFEQEREKQNNLSEERSTHMFRVVLPLA